MSGIYADGPTFDGPTLVKLAAAGLFMAVVCAVAGWELDPYMRRFCIWRWTIGMYQRLHRLQFDLELQRVHHQPEPLHEGRAVIIAAEMGRRSSWV